MKSFIFASALLLSTATAAFAGNSCENFRSQASGATNAIIDSVDNRAKSEYGSVEAARGKYYGLVESQTRQVAYMNRTLANSAGEWIAAAGQAVEYYKLVEAGCK